PVTKHPFHPALKKGPTQTPPEPLALETEIGDLIKRVDHPKPRVKFETVDDPDFVPQPNMLGTQVAVARDDPAMAKASDDEAAAPVQKPALRMIDTLHQAGGNAETTIEQQAPVIGKAPPPVGKMDRRREKDRVCRVIKLRENSHKPVKLSNFNMRLGDAVIEHIALIEPLHEHEPIDRGSGSADREPFTSIHQRQDVEID